MWNSRNLNGLRLRRNTSESGGVIKRNQARSVLCLQMVICLPFKRKIVLAGAGSRKAAEVGIGSEITASVTPAGSGCIS